MLADARANAHEELVIYLAAGEFVDDPLDDRRMELSRRAGPMMPSKEAG